jgi:putative acetyltransferase
LKKFRPSISFKDDAYKDFSPFQRSVINFLLEANHKGLPLLATCYITQAKLHLVMLHRYWHYQIEEVKNLILQICEEIFETTAQIIQKHDPMLDIDRVQDNYFDRQGIFLIVMDANTVVGCGGIKRLDNQTCELKRMWLLKEYRGRGLGWKLAQMLLDFAKQADYQRIRLDVFSQDKQKSAIAFYQKLGFYSIDQYNDSLCQIFMEKILT